MISFLQYGSFLCEWPASTVVDLVQESQLSTAMCIAFRCHLTTSLYRSHYPPRRRFPLANSPYNTAFGNLSIMIYYNHLLISNLHIGMHRFFYNKSGFEVCVFCSVTLIVSGSQTALYIILDILDAM